MRTPIEDIELFARTIARRDGRAGVRYARERVAHLRDLGDTEGAAVWTEVADVIERNEVVV